MKNEIFRNILVRGSDLEPKVHYMLKASKWDFKFLPGPFSNSCDPCSTKTREVLGNPSPAPKRFPEFWWSRTFSSSSIHLQGWIRKSIPLDREGLTVLKSILPCWGWENALWKVSPESFKTFPEIVHRFLDWKYQIHYFNTKYNPTPIKPSQMLNTPSKIPILLHSFVARNFWRGFMHFSAYYLQESKWRWRRKMTNIMCVTEIWDPRSDPIHL